ncbi:MAG: 2-hydroxyacyl-CoA dehydratase family protein [Candidatus Nezhaarchaeota archaeon]|nr:2-hydroxyacyl-CoA dehydratase family protein [Candidatus Nezhaarchaeota archaeon]
MAEASRGRGLETTKGFFRNYVRPYFEGARRAKEEGRPVAWAFASFPIEIAQAFDIYPLWPEQYACLLGALKLSVKYCEVAESRGFSKDLCSYARDVIGSLDDPQAPLGGMPRPDVILTASTACDTHLKWSQALSRLLKVPYFYLDVPYNVSGADPSDVEEEYVELYLAEVGRLIEFLEKLLDTRLDRSKLSRVMETSVRVNDLWMDIMELRKAVPCPMGAEDAWSAVFFVLACPGSQVALDFYTRLKEEVERRVKEGLGVVDEERYRVGWDNLPPWFNLGFYDYLKKLGVVVVVEVPSLTWSGRLDPARPLESLARRELAIYSNSTMEFKVNMLDRLVRDYKLDGFIIPTNWGCRFMSIGNVDLKNILKERHGIPSLVLDLDATDWRVFSEEQAKARVEAFVEAMRSFKYSRTPSHNSSLHRR